MSALQKAGSPQGGSPCEFRFSALCHWPWLFRPRHSRKAIFRPRAGHAVVDEKPIIVGNDSNLLRRNEFVLLEAAEFLKAK